MQKLFDWAETEVPPLAAYATALLARALSIQEVAAKHLQDAARLVGTRTLLILFFQISFYFSC